MLELYHWEPTVNSAEPLILLFEKGIDFLAHYVDVARFEQHAPSYLAINPKGQVPALMHDGRVVIETGFLLQYIEAALPGPSFLPATPAGRFEMQVWARYANDYLAAASWRLGWHHVTVPQLAAQDLAAARDGLSRLPLEQQDLWRKALDDDFPEERRAAARTSLELRVGRLEAALAGSDYVAGPDYSIPDINLFPVVRVLPHVVPELVNGTTTPRIAAWLARIEERPAVQRALNLARTPEPSLAFAPGPEGTRWG